MRILGRWIPHAVAPLVTAMVACGEEPEQLTAYAASAPIWVADGRWRMVVLPDTQHLCEKRPDILKATVDWIIEHHDELDIRFVVQVGDIVQNDADLEWEVARDELGGLGGVVPYALNLGNHDMADNALSRTTHFARYFNWDEFGDPSQPGGRFSGDAWNGFHYLTGTHRDWLVLTLEFAPRDEVLRWANEVIADHPDHLVIVTTHAYLYWNDHRYDFETFGFDQWHSPYGYGIASDEINDGEQIWNKLGSRHANLRFILSGHVLGDGVARSASQGVAGNTVHELVANYQDRVKYRGRDMAWTGFFRVLEFDPEFGMVGVRTYSPFLDEFLLEPDQNFELALDFQLDDESDDTSETPVPTTRVRVR